MSSRAYGISRWLYLWAPVFFYAVFIFFLSSFSLRFVWSETTQKINADKFAHVVEYGLFGFLLGRALWHHGPFWRQSGRLFVVVVLIGVLYGASDEVHQRFVPERDCSALDLAADAAGAALGAWIWTRKRKLPDA